MWKPMHTLHFLFLLLHSHLHFIHSHLEISMHKGGGQRGPPPSSSVGKPFTFSDRNCLDNMIKHCTISLYVWKLDKLFCLFSQSLKRKVKKFEVHIQSSSHISRQWRRLSILILIYIKLLYFFLALDILKQISNCFRIIL